ncbi:MULTISPECIES: hypothetical protein [Streptosporangium]|uniref:Transposase IS111A/IS1328/IS1533 N-terminal domain-containing protein n=1 Tax=Streptosporangium brasiliense TaxID=47480 RepID=A0ABT9RDU9_9ACTN|nr:hypothetical protein [Streptosporangium brasiliense]MDP9866914.1 hypothetical protein [Streptosporangium brasiliense]
MPDSRPVTVTCGIDRAEKHHDVALVDKTGKPVAERRISDADGWRVPVELLTEHGGRTHAPRRDRLRRDPRPAPASRLDDTKIQAEVDQISDARPAPMLDPYASPGEMTEPGQDSGDPAAYEQQDGPRSEVDR